MKNLLPSLTLVVFSLAMVVVVSGCKDSAVSRDVSVDEVQESNARREQHIDQMNVPDAQKQMMKERLGQAGSAR